MRILKTVEFNNGTFWDFVYIKQDWYSIQRNSKTVWGRLSGYGAREIWTEVMDNYKKKHKIINERNDFLWDNVGTVGERKIV